mmetsp:Transcript_25382/g.59039  ORF Transcript_25382/g.59039 Transcript_25382/m.59039 type:complete len:214 (+) Transcript_25382:2359-3000(+)
MTAVRLSAASVLSLSRGAAGHLPGALSSIATAMLLCPRLLSLSWASTLGSFVSCLGGGVCMLRPRPSSLRQAACTCSTAPLLCRSPFSAPVAVFFFNPHAIVCRTTALLCGSPLSDPVAIQVVSPHAIVCRAAALLCGSPVSGLVTVLFSSPHAFASRTFVLCGVCTVVSPGATSGNGVPAAAVLTVPAHTTLLGSSLMATLGSYPSQWKLSC